MITVRNPVLRGFNPDPSVVEVNGEYFIATSTFEWYPGVRLHRSADLAEWQVVGHALDADLGFDLRGVPDSGGVWAPSLSYSEGLFWLAFSIVRSMDGDDKDIDNYLTTAPSIDGPWTEPVHLGSRGFDFSFFHDTDRRHWLVGVQWDHRPDHSSFGGIVLEEYYPDRRETSGTPILIYSQAGLVEGPNLYRIDGHYHLLLAEGGTGWNHGVTSARSRNLAGPYRRDPRPAVLTSRQSPGHPLQKAGHGELVGLGDGSWLMVHLASRPVLHLGERYSPLGRETCLQRIVLRDGWLRLDSDEVVARTSIDLPGEGRSGAGAPQEVAHFRDDFDAAALDTNQWSTLRAPLDRASLVERPGWLRLRGGHSTASVFEQSMIARRVEEHMTRAEILVDAEPRSPRHAAGPIAYYDRQSWIWLQVTWDEEHGRHLRVVTRDEGITVRSAAVEAPAGPLVLTLLTDGPDVTFTVSQVGGVPRTVPGTYDLWKLSDDHGKRLRFTGTLLGVRAEDLDGGGWSADVDHIDILSFAADAQTSTDDSPERTR